MNEFEKKSKRGKKKDHHFFITWNNPNPLSHPTDLFSQQFHRCMAGQKEKGELGTEHY